MASKNNNIRNEGRIEFPGLNCNYGVNTRNYELWLEGWKEEEKDQNEEAKRETNKIKWIDPRDKLNESIDQIQDILTEMKELEDG